MKKVKKLLFFTFAAIAISALASCASSSGDDSSDSNNGNSGSGSISGSATPVIYLAGDSTVKTYDTEQYIAGWGQYLENFLDSKVKVVNCAQGGRSSRSFINEGRLYDIDDASFSYNFSQNDGKSIGSVIKEGDFLFIQFGHNDDDTKKSSSYSTMYNRMVSLGTADSSGIYPVNAGTKSATTYLPEEYTSNVSDSDKNAALAEIAKYGSEYYAYDCGGTYKWFLKQYIDFARSKGAIPVLVTPVARVKFNSDGTEIIGGAGLHGENFAYVQAVKQLASEEDCLLIDLFSETKTLLETAQKAYADYLMALVPNELKGEWPSGYDSTYGNTAAGFSKIEATHYNKYGAFLTAAKLTENIIESVKTAEKHNNSKEYFNFGSHIKTTPSAKIVPSNLISKSTVEKLNALFTTVEVKSDVTYPLASEVVAKIEAIASKGSVTTENYAEFKTLCEEARSAYNALNIDDRSSVTNLSVLEEYENAVSDAEDSLLLDPVETVILNFDSLTTGSLTESSTTTEGLKVVATSSKAVTVEEKENNLTYGKKTYTVKKDVSLGGSAGFGSHRYVEFSTEKACKVTVFASSSGSDDRSLALVSSLVTSTKLAVFDAKSAISSTSASLTDGGTYQLGSTDKGVRIYLILIEYFE